MAVRRANHYTKQVVPFFVFSKFKINLELSTVPDIKAEKSPIIVFFGKLYPILKF